MRYLFQCLLFLLATGSATAQDLPLLPREDHTDWQAIGRVNVAGYKTREMCTGVLVSPNEVLTAAHCLAGTEGRGPRAGEFTFVAGWLQGDAADVVKGAEIWVHPKAYSTGRLNIRYDIALLTLDRDATVIPLPLADTPAAAPFGILGYSVRRPHMLSAAFDCPGGEKAQLLRVNCPVIPGHSGGPVLTRTGETWAVAAIVSARSQTGALAVPVSRLTE